MGSKLRLLGFIPAAVALAILLHTGTRQDRSREMIDIPEGYLACGLPIARSTLPSKLDALPGRRVDIIQSVTCPDGSVIRKTIVSSAMVLAIDSCCGTPNLVVVVFALTEADALKVSLARNGGTLDVSSCFFDRITHPALWWSE